MFCYSVCCKRERVFRSLKAGIMVVYHPVLYLTPSVSPFQSSVRNGAAGRCSIIIKGAVQGILDGGVVMTRRYLPTISSQANQSVFWELLPDLRIIVISCSHLPEADGRRIRCARSSPLRRCPGGLFVHKRRAGNTHDHETDSSSSHINPFIFRDKP